MRSTYIFSSIRPRENSVTIFHVVLHLSFVFTVVFIDKDSFTLFISIFIPKIIKLIKKYLSIDTACWIIKFNNLFKYNLKKTVLSSISGSTRHDFKALSIKLSIFPPAFNLQARFADEHSVTIWNIVFPSALIYVSCVVD